MIKKIGNQNEIMIIIELFLKSCLFELKYKSKFNEKKD